MSVPAAGPDRRRNGGPETSVRPVRDPSVCGETRGPLLSSELVRRDGRYPEQLRPFVLRMGIVTRAPGSAYVEVGDTKLVCSVYGPRSSMARTASRTYQRYGNVSCEINYAPFSALQRCAHQPEAEEQDFAMLLLQAVCPAIRRDLFPNSHVDIYVTVLEQDGSVLSAAIAAASAALVEAGVEMADSVVACSAIFAAEQGVFLMDPAADEERPGSTRCLVALMPNANQLTQLHVAGDIDYGTLGEALTLGTDGARALYENTIRPALEALLVE